MMYQYPPTPAPAPELPPPPASAPRRKLKAKVIVPIALTGVLVLGGAAGTAVFAFRPKPLSLKQRTDKVAAAVEKICKNKKSYNDCDIAVSPGSIEVDTDIILDIDERLKDVGEDTGLWTNSDVARMTRTRPIDGTQKSTDGKVSWTYGGSSDGLHLVITVDESTPLPTDESSGQEV